MPLALCQEIDTSTVSVGSTRQQRRLHLDKVAKHEAGDLDLRSGPQQSNTLLSRWAVQAGYGNVPLLPIAATMQGLRMEVRLRLVPGWRLPAACEARGGNDVDDPT